MIPEANLPSDQELVERILAGDPDSYGILYRRYYRLVLKRCMDVLEGDEHTAEDLTHEAFIRVWCRLSSLRFDKSPAIKAYVLRIAINLALDELRRRQRTPNIIDRRSEYNQERGAHEHDLAKNANQRELKSRLYDAMRNIPDDLTRKCMFDRYIRELHWTDICRAYSITKNRLYYLLRKGRAFVRKELEGHV
jgi:RNA polymerase sigma-70 factor (ECF subfamily)